MTEPVTRDQCLDRPHFWGQSRALSRQILLYNCQVLKHLTNFPINLSHVVCGDIPFIMSHSPIYHIMRVIAHHTTTSMTMMTHITHTMIYHIMTADTSHYCTRLTEAANTTVITKVDHIQMLTMYHIMTVMKSHVSCHLSLVIFSASPGSVPQQNIRSSQNVPNTRLSQAKTKAVYTLRMAGDLEQKMFRKKKRIFCQFNMVEARQATGKPEINSESKFLRLLP